MNQQERRAAEWTPKLRLILLLLPSLLLPYGIFGAAHYPLILRAETVYPEIETARVMVYAAPFMTAVYFAVICRVMKNSASLRAKAAEACLGIVFLFFLLSVMVCGMVQTLNGMLDFSPPAVQRGRAVGTTYIKQQPYTLLQDWQNSEGHVYMRGAGQCPAGTIIVFNTKPGFFGWEWQTS